MNVILALYPNTRGLGFACVNMPDRLVEYGIVTVRPICNERLIKRIRKFLDFYRPKLVVVRGVDADTPRGRRIALLVAEVGKMAEGMDIKLYGYTRQQIKDVFDVFGETTKHGIAHKIAKWFPELGDHAPKIRRPWMDEDYYMGVFDALSLAITHTYLND